MDSQTNAACSDDGHHGLHKHSVDEVSENTMYRNYNINRLCNDVVLHIVWTRKKYRIFSIFGLHYLPGSYVY